MDRTLLLRRKGLFWVRGTTYRKFADRNDLEGRLTQKQFQSRGPSSSTLKCAVGENIKVSNEI